MAVGIISTLVGASLWGISGTCMQFLTGAGEMSPALVTLLRALVGGVLLMAFALARFRDKLAALVRDIRSLAALVLFAFALYANQFCYAKTIQLTNAGTATVLQMLSAAFVMVYVCMIGKHLPKAKELAGLIAAIAATVLIATQGDLSSLHMSGDGLIWGIATGITAAAYVVVPKQTGLLDKYTSLPVVSAGMLLSTLIALPSYLAQGGSFQGLATSLAALDLAEWLVFVAGLAALGTALAYGLYLYGVSIVGPVVGSLLAAVEPVSATVMSAVFLGTAFTGFDITGMVLMCLMVAFIAGPSRRSADRKERSS